MNLGRRATIVAGAWRIATTAADKAVRASGGDRIPASLRCILLLSELRLKLSDRCGLLLAEPLGSPGCDRDPDRLPARTESF